ncbi:paired immunoglobulin-like type 2 receptor alpha isoform X2 [Halichoerus grypus]
MGLSLLLSLLLLPTCLQAGSSDECDLYPDYGIEQPNNLSAPMGGSVHINFSFYYCWQLANDPRVSVALRRKHFHGEVIYNSTGPFIHEEYKNRICLNLPKGQKFGSLQISNLRKEDEHIYFCRVQVETLRDGTKVWQSLQGTILTVTHAAKRTTEGPTTTAPTTTGLSVLEGPGSSASSPLSGGAAVGVALAGAVLIIAILGLILYLRWKKRKGDPSKTQRRNMRTLGLKDNKQSPSWSPSWSPRMKPRTTAASSTPPSLSPAPHHHQHLPASLPRRAPRRRPYILS